MGGFALRQAKDEGMRLQKMYIVLRQSLVFIMLLWISSVICYTNHSDQAYLQSKHVTDTMNIHLTSSECGSWLDELSADDLEHKK